MQNELFNQDDIQRRLQDIVSYPREDLSIELKGWLDLGSEDVKAKEDAKANIAQAILALANHGGGYIVIGFAEANGVLGPASPHPSDLSIYNQDIINGIVQSYADPPFQCAVYHTPHPKSGELFPIIQVPGNHRVPIRSKRDGPNQNHVRVNTYYIRRPGPKSEQPQSGQEWDDLIGRCVRANREFLLDSVKNILLGVGQPNKTTSPEEQAKNRLKTWFEDSNVRLKSLVDEKYIGGTPSPYAKGSWSVAYFILGDFKPPSLNAFSEILSKVEGHETGWPAWWYPSRSEIAPYPFNGVIECWMAESKFGGPALSDFWRASPDGLLFLLRGYEDDSHPDRFEPGQIFDLILPVWRVGECLLHAQRLAVALCNQPSSIIFRVCWEGLKGRVLTAWVNPDRLVHGGRQSRQDFVQSEMTVPVDSISTNLPEIVKSLTQPLYETFDFFSPSLTMFQEELSKMLGHKV